MTENHKENVQKAILEKKYKMIKSPINMITDWDNKTAFI